MLRYDESRFCRPANGDTVAVIPRAAESQLGSYAADFRVVVVNGPRQAGKTTLLRLHQKNYGGEFRSLDDPEMLKAATVDPISFARDAPRPLHIDEVQRAGDPLIRAVKLAVDEDWSPGQFILSGSTRFLTVPTLSESLAGRAGIIELWPLSMAERTGSPENFIDRIFDDPDGLRGAVSPWSRRDYLGVFVGNGYPETLRLRTPATRHGWFRSYLDTVIQRDMLEFTDIQHADAVPQLLALVAARSGGPLVLADLARSLGGLSPDTVRNYLSYLETVFLVGYAPAWSTSLTSKISKTPKVYLTDSGLAAHLMHATPDALGRPGHPVLGGLTETFVFNELTKAASFAETPVGIHHLRDRDGREIDFILESPDGRVVAIEVRSSASPSGDATRHLRWLRDRLGERFVAGVQLYLGGHALSHGDRILAAPLSVLWSHAPMP